ncbi:unnamed protein product [Owenia fusiformis]|uniref:FERM domain-containing protein n=1 Tax=Owenia fusiformis TaxID=6347 RepID=A0A8S4PUU6_OWEFU|nr:unnamed protein product [Owenia fusiformis]
MFKRKSSKGYVNIEYQCTIRFLDESDPITASFQKETKGQELLDHVCKYLNLVEKDYFGLRYVDDEKQRHWLNPLKSVHKQLKNVHPMVMCFRVKFYPPDPMKLKEEITRYFLFLQLRRDLQHGRLLCSPADANLLAAYILQSEVGDYDPEDHPPEYVSEFKMLPKQTEKMEEKIAEIHKGFQSQEIVPSVAEEKFLIKAATLDTYGVDPHPVKDQKGNQMYLGVTHLGIVTFQGNRRTHLFKWTSINRIAFEGKMFIVHVTIAEKKHACGFKCQTFAACKHLWKCAVEQQYFFTLNKSADAPKVTSGGGFFTRRSKFRYSGRCQKEVVSESEVINREPPEFTRSQSVPHFPRHVSKSTSRPNSLISNSAIEEIETAQSVPDVMSRSLEAEVRAPIAPEELSIPEEEEVKISDTTYEPNKSAAATPDQEEPPQDLASDNTTPENLDAQIEVLQKELEEAKSMNHSGEKADVPDEEQTSVMTTEPIVEHSKDNGVVNTDKPQDDIKPDSSRSTLKTVAAVITLLLVVALVGMVLVMETDYKLPLVSEMRGWPETKAFRASYYDPARNYVTKMCGSS